MDRHRCDVGIGISSGTEAAILLIKEKLELGYVPSLEETLHALVSRGKDSEAWRLFLDSLDPRQQPTDMEDLGQLTYVFAAVKPALSLKEALTHHDIRWNVPNRKLIIQVDDIRERKILDRAKAFIKEYAKKKVSGSAAELVILGLFPNQKVFAAGPGRSDLDFEDSGLQLCLGSTKEMVGPLDIMSRTYGMHIGNQVRHSCLRQGFQEII